METQPINTEGDFAAVEALVEGYRVKVDQTLHPEVMESNKQFTADLYIR
ncbi:hypothetical protein [Ulvibacter sp. MAR_2010_11]|nr:hypothetical protein [Ulvibacter sp. MAR_2010_11]